MSGKGIFEGRTLVLATMHGKENVIRDLLEKHLGVRVIVPQGFNTDKFGSFSGEKERPGNQLETARLKAEAAMLLTGADLALASEGAFHAHHAYYFAMADYELVLLKDKKNNSEWQGWHISLDVQASTGVFKSVEEAQSLSRKFNFPSHALIIKVPEKNGFKYLRKGIRNDNDLRTFSEEALKMVKSGEVAIIENDLRANQNPTRMNAIEEATKVLIGILSVDCPSCNFPGFKREDSIPGLPCSNCGAPTALTMVDIYRCPSCNFELEEERKDGNQFAEPQYCMNCNP